MFANFFSTSSDFNLVLHVRLICTEFHGALKDSVYSYCQIVHSNQRAKDAQLQNSNRLLTTFGCNYLCKRFVNELNLLHLDQNKNNADQK
jgi:hypothetical protein